MKTNRYIILKEIEANTLVSKIENLEKLIKELLAHPESEADRLMTRKETAKLLGVSLVTLHNWVKDGRLTAYRIGKGIRFKETEVLQSLNQIGFKL